MKLYEFAPAPSARRVSIFMAEKHIEIERIPVDIRAGENLTPEFKLKSSNGRIPLLQLDDGTTLCESMAICRYLDEAFPTDHHLFGDTPLSKGQVEMWNRIAEIQGLFPAFQAFRNITGLYKDRERCIPEWGTESKRRLVEFLPDLDFRLSQSPYLAGDHFTVADITAFVMCGFIKNIDIEVNDTYESISNWREKIANRPSIAR